MSFSGFSEADIRKLTKTQDVNKPQKNLVNKASLKKVTFKPNNITNASRSKNVLNNNTANNCQVQELPENAKLSVPNKKIDNDSKNINKDLSSHTQSAAEEINSHKEETSPQIITPIANSEKKFRDLDEFDARQKLIEEQNRKRKELLVKALADRTKQTREETQRLNEIQEEFKKLDAMLSSDVKILRKEIEVASIDYMECQKRYHKIEKEFLDAKVVLHQKLERKEMLTEHLCTIIEKNEERKAEKLNELLQKLQVDSLVIDNDTADNKVEISES